jgi:hypothetical protein
MKLICLLFSVYILYLISLPCRDGASCVNDIQADQTTQHNHSGDHDHADGCSPFCICSCCNATVILNGFHFESTPVIIPVQVDFILKELKSENYLASFWSHPKALPEIS